MSGSEIRKNLIKIFQECGLSIVSKINLTSVDFLDVHFDMKQETYTPYRKPNNALYTSTNIQITHKIYLEISQSPLVKESQILLQMKRYSHPNIATGLEKRWFS